MTRREKFLELFPNAELNFDEQPMLLPCTLDTTIARSDSCKCLASTCVDCFNKYWNKELNKDGK